VGSARYSRNEALFGADGQAKIAATKIAIIGLGGLGSHVAQQLAYLGVRDYALVDFDIVTESSLNRLVGAVDADVAAETKKIAVAERTIKAVKPDATVVAIDGKVADAGTEAAISRADVVFGCLDRDIHRLELTDLCGTRCLVCLPEILNQDEIARDRMSPEQREADRRIYGVDREALAGTGPAVVSINGVVASLAVTEFMVYVTGLREPAAQLTYRGERGIVTKSLDDPEPTCYYCTRLWGTAAARG